MGKSSSLVQKWCKIVVIHLQGKPSVMYMPFQHFMSSSAPMPVIWRVSSFWRPLAGSEELNLPCWNRISHHLGTQHYRGAVEAKYGIWTGYSPNSQTHHIVGDEPDIHCSQYSSNTKSRRKNKSPPKIKGFLFPSTTRPRIQRKDYRRQGRVSESNICLNCCEITVPSGLPGKKGASGQFWGLHNTQMHPRQHPLNSI